MLRALFENTQSKGAKKRKRNFWLYSLGEFVLIFLGILIALQVDNWNQKRHDRKLERVLLSEMHSNLKGDLSDLNYNVNTQEVFLNSCQIALDFLNSEDPWHDSLGWYFNRLMAGTVFDSNNSAYESLNSIGIDLVRNDSLRQQIAFLYAARYHKIEETQNILFTHIFDHLYPALRVNLQTLSWREMTVPVDLDALRQNNGFKEDLHMTLFIYRLSILIYERARVDIVKLIADIEEELKTGDMDS